MKSEKIDQIVDIAATLAARADEFDQVLVLYRRKDAGDKEIHGSFDNDLEVRDCLWLVEMFKTWMFSATVLKGDDE